MKCRYPLRVLGSKYGAWSFLDRPELFGSTIISAGLGEDASFDIEFANAYNARVVFIDPTPRSIIHFDKICLNLGRPKKMEYIDGGDQPIGVYDLSKINAEQLFLVEKALWVDSSPVRFYKPSNEKFVSHSILGAESNPNVCGDYIEVNAIEMQDVICEFGLSNSPELVKMDIEFAGCAVINSMLEKGILPMQILVEFEGLDTTFINDFNVAHSNLISAGYYSVDINSDNNFLFVRCD